MSILEVHNVSIRYMTGDFKEIGLKEYVMRKAKNNYHVHEFWADRNISFTLEEGEMLGIIGTNGAGKSTLLKVVSGIMEPTKGYVKRQGNVAALLELGSGFDGDLTVRENAYLRGAMLGYTRKFMDEMYEQIIDFAELREFQDRPFKQLSSGMKSRLAFAIASLVRPDILILDEVLSVGDGAFRKKSEEKMREIIAGGAATILVSHSLDQVREMCTKVLWIEKGEQIACGDTETICDLYQQYLDKAITLDQARAEWNGPDDPGEQEGEELSAAASPEESRTGNESEQEDERMKELKKQDEWPNINWPWRRVSGQFKTAFIAALALGLITHLYMFTNLLLNHDSVMAISGTTFAFWVSQWRWFLPVLDKVSTNFQLPVVIGLLSLLALAVTAGLTVCFLQIKSKLGAIITAGFIVMTPAAAAIMSYLFTADTYFLAMAMCAATAYMVKKYKHGWIPGLLLLTLANGTYQAYVCYAIGLMLLDCILRLLSGEDIKKVIWAGIKYVAVVAASLLLAYLIATIIAHRMGVSFMGYQGRDKTGLSMIPTYIRAIPAAYKSFFAEMLDPTVFSPVFRVVQIVFLVLIPVDIAYLTVARKIYKNVLRTLLLAAGVCMIPLALNFASTLTVNGRPHLLMFHSFVLIFIFGIKLLEMNSQQMEKPGDRRWKIRFLVSGGLACALLWNGFCVSNIGYLRLQTVYENSYALCNRVVARIESVEGYSPSMPVVIIGSPLNNNTYGGIIDEFSQYNKMTGMNDRLILDANNSQERHFIESYIGTRMPQPSVEQRQAVIDSGLVEEMPVYPAEGSVTLYDGIIVVKFSNSDKVH